MREQQHYGSDPPHLHLLKSADTAVETMDDRSTSDESIAGRNAALARRQQLTHDLANSPYDLILYLDRAVVHQDLGYPDLAAGDAYRALLLTDEVRGEGVDYRDQAREALQAYSIDAPPDVLNHGALAADQPSAVRDDHVHIEGSSEEEDAVGRLAEMASVRCYQMLSLSLLLCGCLRSSYQFCERGLAAAPANKELLETREYIETVAQARLRGRGHLGPLKRNGKVALAALPEWGVVRREIYPWNNYEPNRSSEGSLAFLNSQLAKVAPKCVVQLSELPVLLDCPSDSDAYDLVPTTNQLGLFAKEAIAPGEAVLREYSLLTASNRLEGSTCDACGTGLPPLSERSTAVNCTGCHDTVFCDDFCFSQAQDQYHPAVCDKDVDVVAKDPDPAEADQALYLLLLARLLAMAAHQRIHPLDVKEVKYIWGDFVPSRSNDIDPSPNAEPPPDWTLPFSFRHNIETPLHILERMGMDVFLTLADYDIWVFNTLYAKFRGTASARKSMHDGRPEVAAVHPLWCLANHDCDPNVQWEWGGKMVLSAREESVTGRRPPGIRAGDQILSHYCDVRLPVEERREWAKGSLGGLCMCQRCREELAS
jgi:hypothetical protein